MGVTRDGLAYVLFSNEELFEVSVFDATCTASAYQDTVTGFGAFGMGYSTDSSSTADETLFVANAGTLGSLDTSSWLVSNIGSIASQPELTGNSLGQLWAFMPLLSQVAQIDKSDATVIESYVLPGFPSTGDIDCFAFAQWGGQLYIFMRLYGMGNTTNVYVSDTDSESFELVLEDVGFDVVGAGVSTCAPVVIE